MYHCNYCNLFSSKMNVTVVLGIVVLLHLVSVVPWRVCSQRQRLFVKRTLVQNTSATDALCLDGSLPAYHLHRGFGAGQNNWLLQFEGGGWCNDLKSCLNRSTTRLGSTRYDKSKLDIFAGILSNDSSLNPDFYNWNRVRLRYCDGASFTGDAVFDNGTTKLYFKGQKIWEAIIQDLLPKGLGKAHQALLSGCSAGGLATFHHCDNFAEHLPSNASVKCLSDAGFFLDGRDISSKYTARNFFKGVVELQGVKQNLNRNCTRALSDPDLCFIPQYVLKYIATPYFILNSAYDVYQFNNILVPPSADINGVWKECKKGLVACTPDEINILQGFRRYMLETLKPFLINSESGGMFINSCFAHCQGDVQDTWFGNDSPRLNNKTIAEAVGDWYFGRNRSKEIDCAYPCDKTCHNLIPKKPPQVTAKPSSQQKGGRDFFLHSYTSEH